MILTPFYMYNAVFDGSAQITAQLLKLLMDRGVERGYFLELAELLFIANS